MRWCELLKADQDLAKAIDPRECSLHYPAAGCVAGYALFRYLFIVPAAEVRNVPRFRNDLPARLVIIPSIKTQMLRLRGAGRWAHDHRRVQRRCQQRQIRPIGASDHNADG